ncbi:AAC(3) family N-acetyltransferase (plasmid) [Streptomyces sp. NBC_00876]|uniref:aminoglycoside N(3)-acetyltransferase n=1 Tax=Streptomyces sp. NBC_00876 TaxID=2975853 RepID=UPI002F9171C9|nr:AAC(3) family N-acetyltransferase [Streptomyces sp. NBC_00876]
MLHPAAGPETPGPYSRGDLVNGLRDSGVAEGDVVMVHAAISSLGWTAGGGVALVQALREVVGRSGTLVVAAFTTYLTDPMTWVERPVPPSWWPRVRQSMVPFDPALHPAQPKLGRLPEVVRSLPGARRSPHPLYSFVASGPAARSVLTSHPMGYGLGARSPLAALCRASAKVLMIGVGWDKCTVLHLAEHLTPYPGRRSHRMDVPRPAPGGATQWEPSVQLVMYEGDYADIGAEATRAGLVRSGRVGAAPVLLVPAAELVDLGSAWLARHRDLSGWLVAPNMTGVTEAPATAL